MRTKIIERFIHLNCSSKCPVHFTLFNVLNQREFLFVKCFQFSISSGSTLYHHPLNIKYTEAKEDFFHFWTLRCQLCELHKDRAAQTFSTFIITLRTTAGVYSCALLRYNRAMQAHVTKLDHVPGCKNRRLTNGVISYSHKY